jgi:Uma2 family endonuclease
LLRLVDSGSIELVDGQLVEKTVSIESSEVEGLILTRIQSFLLVNPIAKAYPATLGYRCFPDDPDKIRKPDCSVVLLDRLKIIPDPDAGYMPIVPDLAVEVISPNDIVYEIDAKVQEYHQAAFPLIWIVDPKARTVTVHPLNGKPVIFAAADELTAASALPGFRCRAGDFFPSPASASLPGTLP